MKQEILLEKDFISWFVDIMKYPLPTAKSYCDYIFAADKYLDIYSTENNEKSNLLTALSIEVNNGNAEGMTEIIDNATDELSRENIEIKLQKSLKYIQNWKSALYQYKEFLQTYIDDKSTSDPDQPEDTNFASDVKKSIAKEEKAFQNKYIKRIRELFSDEVNYIYTKKDLYKKFHFRLTTQDRYYDEIYYPINFISRFLYGKGERTYLDNWVREMLNAVIVHLEDETITLKNVAKLSIDDGSVFVDLNDGRKKMILTKTSDNVRLVPFSVNKIKQIVLDHDTSMYNIMLENIQKFQTFQQITSELQKLHSGKMTAKKFKRSIAVALKSDFIESINIESLKSEMELIASFTKLQLMDSTENTKKGKH
ncbi:MAG TPA: hypothetical protein PLE74_12615 [Candidatus Cloacimonadota bacterium]|nr:hypothetical protein [Candidatus Cloacimonadota bacterium]